MAPCSNLLKFAPNIRVVVMQLCYDSLTTLEANENDGNISIIVGVAFRHRVLTDAPPFCGKNASKGKGTKKRNTRQKANKLMRDRVSSEYDCVEL